MKKLQHHHVPSVPIYTLSVSNAYISYYQNRTSVFYQYSGQYYYNSFAPEKTIYMHNMNHRTFLGLAFSLIVTAGCSDEKVSNGVIHSVMLTHPEGSDNQQQRTLAGTIEEAREISVGFKTPGQIARIAVKEGDYIREGQLIAVLDDKDMQLEMQSMQIRYDQTKREVERLSRLQKSSSISGNDYDKAESGLKQLGTSLQSLKNQLSYTRLYAPTSGYVQAVNFEVSEMVDAGRPVITLLDTKQMEVICNIPASVYMERSQIQSISCSGRFSKGTPVPVSLISIAPKADASQLYKMRLALKGSTADAISGQNVEVTLNMNGQASAGTLTIPMASVINENGKNYVMTFEAKDSTVHRKEVSLGSAGAEGQIQITGGLSSTQQLVKAGVTRLVDGEKVRVVND